MTQPTIPGGASGEFLALPPGVGRRVRNSSVAMGVGQLFAGIVIAAVTIGLAFAQKSLDDPLWVVNLAGVVPPLLVVCLAFAMFRARGCVSGDRLVMPRAGRVRATLRRLWLAVVIVAVLIIVAQAVGLAVASGNSAVSPNLSLLDDAAFAVPVVTIVVCSVGFLIGRNLLPPPPEVLAKAWATGH